MTVLTENRKLRGTKGNTDMVNPTDDVNRRRTMREVISEWLNQPTTRRSFVSPWVAITICFVLSLGLLSYQSEARARDACLSRATGISDIKLVLSGMIVNLASDADQDALLDLVDSSIDSIDPTGCPNPKVLFVF